MSQESSSRIVHVDGRRRRPWALATQEKLLNAAVTEIAEKGFSHARLSDIAKRADMTAGSIYTWFDNKEDLFGAALKHALIEQLTKNNEALDKIEVENSYLTSLAALVPRNYTELEATDAQRLLIECYYAAWREPHARTTLLSGIESLQQMYVEVLSAGQEAGLITKSIHTESLATVLMSMHAGTSLLTLAGVPRINDLEWMEIYGRMFEAFSP